MLPYLDSGGEGRKKVRTRFSHFVAPIPVIDNPAPSLSIIKEDISAFSNLEITPFSLTFGPKKAPFSFKMRSF